MDDMAVLDAPTETITPPASTPVADSTPESSTPGDGGGTTPMPSEAARAAAPPPPQEIEWVDDEDEPQHEDDRAEAAPAAAEEEDTGPLIGSERLGTRGLKRLLKESPDLGKAIEGNRQIGNRLFQMARQVDEFNEIRGIVPNKAAAEQLRSAAESLGNVERLYQGEDPQAFLQALYDASLYRDADGSVRSTGAYDRVVQHAHRLLFDVLERRAIERNDQNLSTAVRVLRERMGFADASPANGTPAAADVSTLPPQIRQQLQRADQDRRELEQLRARRSNDEAQARESFLDDTAAQAADELRGFASGLLANTNFSDYEKRNIVRDFIEAVSDAADKDAAFTSRQNEILQQYGHTPQARAQIVSMATQWARQNGREILQPILRELGASLKIKAAQKAAAPTARREPAAAGAPAAPRLLDAKSVVANAEKKAGRRLTDREILELA